MNPLRQLGGSKTHSNTTHSLPVKTAGFRGVAGNSACKATLKLMSQDTSHLNALLLGLSNERARLAEEKTEHGRKLRRVWIEQKEREIEGERQFLGLKDTESFEGTDDELLEALLS